jgi:TP901 family phage tail tape measure protein
VADRTVSVALIAKMQGYTRPMRDGVAANKEFGGSLDKVRRESQSGFREMSVGAAAVGVALAGLVGWALKTSMAFDKQMSEVQAVTGATADELKELREAALEAGKSTVFSATEAAKAQAELAKAGLTSAQILGGGLSGALSLAAAGSLDLAEAADIAAKTMNVFNLEAGAVGHIADMLAGAANATATDVHEMGEALRMGGLAANAAGMSMDDTVVVLGAFADSALVGSDAGTSLKVMLQMLANPTEKSSKLMRELGIDVYDAAGNFVGASKLSAILREKLGGLTQEQRNAALATIFGADAMRAANVLYGLGAEGLAKYNEKINAQANAAQTAAIKTDNLAGDVERLKGSLETLAIEASEGANGGLRFLVQALDSLVSWFGDLPGPVQTAITVLAGVSGASLLVVAGMLKIRSTVGDALQALRDMGPAGETAAKGIGKFGKALGAVTVLGAGFLAAKEFFEWLSEKMGPIRRDADAMGRSLTDLATTGRLTGEMAKVFGENWSRLAGAISATDLDAAGLREFDAAAASAANSQQHLLEGSIAASEQADRNHVTAEQFKSDMVAVDSALKAMVEGGGATQAAMAYNLIREQWVATGAPLSRLNELLPQYNTATANAKAATAGAAKGFGDAASNARTLADGLQGAVDKGQSLLDIFNQLNGAQLGLSEANIKAEASLDNWTEAMKESSGSMDINTEAGRKARSGLNDIARSAAEVAQKTYEQTDSTAEAKRAYDAYIKKVKDAVVGTDGHKQAVHRLIDEVTKMPQLKTTTVTVKVNAGALNALEARLSKYDDTNIGWKGATGGPSGKGMQRASGGPVNMGQTTRINERGEEFLTASRHMYVNPAGSGGGPIVVTIPVTLIDPMTGAATRKALITEAVNRGKPQAAVAAAYP